MKAKITTEYHVVKYSPTGQFIGIMSGMGRNKGTLDSSTPARSTALKWANECRRDDCVNTFVVEEVNG